MAGRNKIIWKLVWNDRNICLDCLVCLAPISPLPRDDLQIKISHKEALLQDHRYFIKAGRASHRLAHNHEPLGKLQHNNHQEPRLRSGLLQGHMQRSWCCPGAPLFPSQPPSNRFSLAAFPRAAQEPREEPHGSPGRQRGESRERLTPPAIISAAQRAGLPPAGGSLGAPGAEAPRDNNSAGRH